MRFALPIARLWLVVFATGGLWLGTGAARAQDAGNTPPIDWSVGLRGSYSHSSLNGVTYEGIIAPDLRLTLQGPTNTSSLDTGGEFSIDQNKMVQIGDAHVNGDATMQLNEDTSVEGIANLRLSQPSANDSTLPAGTVTPPLELDGTASGSITRKLGHFDLKGTLTGERFIEGPTTLTGGVKVDNTNLSYWRGAGELRIGYEITPIVSVFVDGADSYSKFDAADPVVHRFLDGRTYTLRGGVSYTQPGTLEAEASFGRAWLDYTDAGVTDTQSWVADGRLTFTPDATTTLVGSLNTTLAPSTTESGDTDLGYTLNGTAKVQLNPWVTLRGSTGAYRTVTLAAGNTDWGYSAGVGVDLASSRHVVWSADYLFTHDDSSVNGVNDTHAVTVGVTVKR